MKDRIMTSQLLSYLFVSLLGVTYLFGPRIVGENAGRDGWLSILLTGVLLLGISWFWVDLSRKFPRQTVFQYAPRIAGPYAGKALGLSFILLFILTAGSILRTFGDLIKVFLLEETPLEVVMLTFLFTAVYAAGYGLNVVVRLSQVFLPLILILLILVLGLGQTQAQYEELLPIMARGALPVLTGIPPAWRLFTGFLGISVVVAYLDQAEQSFPTVAAGIGLVVLVETLTFVTTVAALGPVEINLKLYPVMELAKELEIPGAFLERMEIFVILLWILAASVAMAGSLFFAALGASQVLDLREHRPMVLMVLPLIYLTAILPPDLLQAIALGTAANYLAMLLALAGPALWAVSLIFRGKEVKDDQKR